jgi:Spy/CpxP family protein refolding chaperone
MKSMKSIVRTGIVGGVAAVFVASVAIAGGQDQERRGPGMRGQGPGGPGGRGMFPAIMRQLTEEQRTQVRAILDEQREQGPPADATLRRDLEAELLADAPNDQKIEELKQQIVAAQSEGLSRHIAVQKRIAQILTPEQRARAREQLAQEPRGRGRF